MARCRCIAGGRWPSGVAGVSVLIRTAHRWQWAIAQALSAQPMVCGMRAGSRCNPQRGMKASTASGRSAIAARVSGRRSSQCWEIGAARWTHLAPCGGPVPAPASAGPASLAKAYRAGCDPEALAGTRPRPAPWVALAPQPAARLALSDPSDRKPLPHRNCGCGRCHAPLRPRFLPHAPSPTPTQRPRQGSRCVCQKAGRAGSWLRTPAGRGGHPGQG